MNGYLVMTSISAFVALVLVASFVHTLVTNKNFQWSLVWQYFGTKRVLHGLLLTVWLIRSVPPLVQLIFWYELASLGPKLSLGIPFGHEFVTFRTAHLFTGILAAFVGLTLDVAAFSSEIIRGGLLSVEHGQSGAAEALGVGRVRIFRKIVLPKAVPAIVPASGNMLIGMLKATSIVSVPAAQDLLRPDVELAMGCTPHPDHQISGSGLVHHGGFRDR